VHLCLREPRHPSHHMITQALLNPERMMSFLEEKVKTLGTSACPPYHLAVVIGGLSAEQTLKTVKYASARYYDNLHTRRVLCWSGCLPGLPSWS
jgi:tartrate dehydratase alpha subunit/fumarate hydratase class I-like protein